MALVNCPDCRNSASNQVSWRRRLGGLVLIASLTLIGSTAMCKTPIDYGSLFVGKDAPPGTMSKLRRAAELAARGAGCTKVTTGAYLPTADEDPEHPGDSYYITCADSSRRGPLGGPAYYNVFFSDADIDASVSKNEPKPVPTAAAIAMCKKALVARLRFPSSAKFSFLPVEAGAKGTENQRIVLDFTTLNGFGNRIPQRGTCIITPRRHTDVSIRDR